jgi:hypothetical protein
MSRMIEVTTPVEVILVEQALAMARELEAVTDAAPDGQVLASGEAAAVRCGRELTRRALEAALQRQADAVEQKGLPRAPAPAAGDATTRGRRKKPR